MAFTVIKTTAFPAVTQVLFYEETIAHVNEEHPEVKVELPCMFDAVARAIQQPSLIEANSSNTFVFVDTGTVHNGDPLRVPVKVVEGTSARVRTVYFASGSANPNIVMKREP